MSAGISTSGAQVATGSTGARALDPIVAEAIINAPVDEVWHAWATGEGLRSWLAPHADIELRVGGTLRTNYAPAGVLGDSTTIENRILSMDPPRMLSIQVSKAPASFPFPGAIYKMWTVVYFVPTGEGRTHVRVVGHGFEEEPESRRMRDFFEQGNAATLQLLQRRFTSTSNR